MGNVSQYNLIYNCWLGLSDGNVTLSRNISEDPLFVNESLNDYHLLLGSPAVDAGLDAGIYVDFDGIVRPYDIPGINNNGTLPDFDIGAYEVPEPATVFLFGLGGLVLRSKRKR